MNKHEEYLKIAIEMAKEAKSKDEVPVGAVIVWQDQVIAKAGNARETSKDPLAHAEVFGHS